MKSLIWFVMALALAASALLAVALWRGDESFGIARLWERLAGPPDLGDVDFAVISRRPSGNDALFCPATLCGTTQADGVAPIFAVPPARLRDAVHVIAVNDPDIDLIGQRADPPQDRFLARTRLLRFPDTVNVRYVDLGNGRSTLAMYSRSQIGRSDFGVNRQRLADWLAEIGRNLPLAQP